MNYINYTLRTKDTQGKSIIVQSGYVSDSGTHVFIVPDEVPAGGMIILEWEPREPDNGKHS